MSQNADFATNLSTTYVARSFVLASLLLHHLFEHPGRRLPYSWMLVCRVNEFNPATGSVLVCILALSWSTRMSADDLIRYLSWIIYVVIFIRVLLEAIRYPLRANVNIALFFAAPALIITLNTLSLPELHILQSGTALSAVNGMLLLSLAYIVMRLVRDFTIISPWVVHLTGLGWLLLSASLFAIQPPRPAWLTGLMMLYFICLQGYGAVVFVRESRRASGVTRRRMIAIAAGSLSLGLVVFIAGLTLILPGFATGGTLLTQTAGLVSGISYFIGFATPTFLRRAWQEPELRTFLGRAATLPRLPTTEAIVKELERGAAASTGAPDAGIGLWDEERQTLRFVLADGQVFDYPPGEHGPTAKAFNTQQATFSANAAADNPDYADVVEDFGAIAILAAPITAGERRLGVLVVYAPRAPIFARDDLELVQLLADQAAVILESRALIDESTRVRAREEATRLKEDFLSAAAHDLKTPLTTLVAQAQLLEYRARRDPQAPVNLAGIQRIEREALRLKELVLQLLDASRVEHNGLLGQRVPLDLVALAEEVCERYDSERHRCLLEVAGPVEGQYDRIRILQLLENLVENATKYSPEGGDVRVRLWRENGAARVTVEDSGVGIPPADLPHVFDRFYRGDNVDDRSFAGMGLGLFICRGIAEQHGGRIWATSELGRGSTFHVLLPGEPAPNGRSGPGD
jgi:signal transduction histidine kinase